MKIRLNFEKTNLIRLIVAMIFAAVLYYKVTFPVYVLAGFGVSYFLIKSFSVELNNKWLRLALGILMLGGMMDYRNMRPVHKAMMAMLKKMLLKKPESERSTEEKGLLAAYDRPVDFTDRAALAPLIAWCRDEA